MDVRDYERIPEAIGLGDFERLSGLPRNAILRTMGSLRPEIEDLYSLPVLILHCCCGRLPDAARLAELRAGSRLLTTRDGRTWSVLDGLAGPDDTGSPAPSLPGLCVDEPPVCLRAGQHLVLLCQVQWCYSDPGPCPDVSPGIQKRGDNSGGALLRRHVQWRPATIVLRLDGSSGIKQRGDSLGAAIPRRPVQRRPSAISPRRDVGSGVQQRGDNLGGAASGRHVQRRPSVSGPRPNVGSGIQQDGNNPGGAAPRRQVQRCQAMRRPLIRIRPDVGPGIQQRGDNLGGAVPRRQVQRRQSVLVPSRDVGSGVKAGPYVISAGGLEKGLCVPLRTLGPGESDPRHKHDQNCGSTERLHRRELPCPLNEIVLRHIRETRFSRLVTAIVTPRPPIACIPLLCRHTNLIRGRHCAEHRQNRIERRDPSAASHGTGRGSSPTSREHGGTAREPQPEAAGSRELDPGTPAPGGTGVDGPAGGSEVGAGGQGGAWRSGRAASISCTHHHPVGLAEWMCRLLMRGGAGGSSPCRVQGRARPLGRARDFGTKSKAGFRFRPAVGNPACQEFHVRSLR